MSSDWCVVTDNNNSSTTSMKDPNAITLETLRNMFSNKPDEKLSDWLKLLLSEEFEQYSDLAALTDEEWCALSLPLAVKTKLKAEAALHVKAADQATSQAHLSTMSTATVADPSPSYSVRNDASSSSWQQTRKIQQLDCIVLDVSLSMKSRSAIDPLKTREDVSKLAFHSMVDGMLGIEMEHALALIAFGERTDVISAGTMNYDKFHDELGRLDANQGRTKLYDSILAGAQLLLDFARSNPSRLASPDVAMRLFVLTDGEDNASTCAPWEVAAFLQTHKIVLDAFPMASHNAKLQSVASCTGGYCVQVKNEEQGVALFSREAVMHVPSRDLDFTALRRVSDQASLRSFEDASAVKEDVQTQVPKQVQRLISANTVSRETAEKELKSASSSAAIKRIMKEYQEFGDNKVERWSAYPSEGDLSSWKLLMRGPDNTVYENGLWIVTVQFPSDYPFKPPRVRFLTPIYHCNISREGGLCLDILKDNWSPALTVGKVCLSISALLTDPNPQDPLDCFKGELYKTDRKRYDTEARQFTQKHASDGLNSMKKMYNL